MILDYANHLVNHILAVHGDLVDGVIHVSIVIDHIVKVILVKHVLPTQLLWLLIIDHWHADRSLGSGCGEIVSFLVID